MYKIKKITVSLLLVMVMLMAFCIPAMAVDTTEGIPIDIPIIVVDENSSNSAEESHVEIPVITVDENSNNANGNSENSNDINSSKENNSNENISNEEEITPYANSITNVDPLVIRSGDSTTCQLYLFWESTGETWNSFRWNQLKVISTSSLFPTTYATIGQKTVKGVGGAVGSVYVQDVSIPTNVSKVKVTSTGFQGYRLTPSPGWFSFTELNDTATIN